VDETTQMVLGAIEKMNEKLDDLKETVAEYTTSTESRLATIEQWKRSSEQADIDRDARIRRLEDERATAKALEELKDKYEKQQEEIGKLKEKDAAVSMKDKIWGAIIAVVASGAVSLLVHYLTGK
jgi:predicted RNase H-like nuclease (RuvC/YqgF family)